MFKDIRVIIIYMLSQSAEPMVLTSIPQIPVLKAKSKLRLVHRKIHLTLEKSLHCWNVSNRQWIKTEVEVNIHVRVWSAPAGQLWLRPHTPFVPISPGYLFQPRRGETYCKCACLWLCLLDRPFRPTSQLACLQSLMPGWTPWINFSDCHLVAPCSWR